MRRPTALPLLGQSDVFRLVRAPRASRTFARLLLALFVAVALLLAVLPWQQNSIASGRVIAFTPLERQQTLDAPVEGRVVRWHVQEGGHVELGDPVADISDNDPEIMARLQRERDAVGGRIDAAHERVAAIKSRVQSLEASRAAAILAAESRVRMARDRVRAAEQALVSAEAALHTAELNVQRQQALLGDGLASKRAVELAELEVVRTRTDVDRARASLQAARSEEAALASDVSKTANDARAAIDDGTAARAASQAEIANGTAELARIEVRLARQATQAVTAPRAGTILRIVARPGSDIVKMGDPLAVFVPDADERAAEVWVDGLDVNLVHPGRPVRLQFEGWPAVQFGGWPTLAFGTFGGRVAFVDATDDGTGRFRVVVVPDAHHEWPGAAQLRQGMRVHAWILLDRVRLGYELWRQLNGFPPQWLPPPGDVEASGSKKGASK